MELGQFPAKNLKADDGYKCILKGSSCENGKSCDEFGSGDTCGDNTFFPLDDDTQDNLVIVDLYKCDA